MMRSVKKIGWNGKSKKDLQRNWEVTIWKHIRSEWMQVSQDYFPSFELEDTHKDLAPSQAEIRLKLTMSENKAGLASGQIGWLNEGISLEHSQYAHFFDISLIGCGYVFI